MEKEAPPLTSLASKLWTRAGQSCDFAGSVAMTTTALCFFIQNPQTSPGKIPASHKWASILFSRQGWTESVTKNVHKTL